MSLEVHSPLLREKNVAAAVALFGAVTAAALIWAHREALLPAYRFAGLACLEPAVGSLIFLLIFCSTGGRWGRGLLPYFGAGVRLLPWLWLALMPLLWLGHYPPRNLDPDQHLLRLYSGRPALIGRSIGYTFIFFLFRWLLSPLLPTLNRAKIPLAEKVPSGVERWIGPVGLIVLTFMMHLLAVDWLLATEPNWSSTGFPLVWLCGQAVAGFSLAVAAAVYGGASPSALGSEGEAVGLDWGNLLLASIMFWVYVAFVQLLIIWSGNLPRETSWYLHRWHGGWRGLFIGVMIFHFAVPFFVLLSRELKRTAGLSVVASLVFLMQMLYVAWMILPSYPLSGFFEYGAAGALFLAGAGLFLNRYFSLAGEGLTRKDAPP